MARIQVIANAVGRIAVRGARSNRILRAGATAAGTTLRSTGRVLRLLFLQLVGVLFLLFAGRLAFSIPSAYQQYQAGAKTAGHFYTLVLFAGMFAWFGATSLWRSKGK